MQIFCRRKETSMKKRGTALLLALILGICMAGCGAQSEETDDSSQTAQTQDDTDTGNSQEEEQGSAGGQGNVLVAYFSWADNAVLEDDVDAVSSPSVIPPGNVQQLAGWVQEGALKPLLDATLEEHTISAGKVAVRAKFTEETLTDFPSFVAEVEAEMINKLGLKEENGILSGRGSAGEIKGVGTDMPAFSLDSFKVEKPNMFDALVAAYAQIVSTSEMSYRPNLVLMHPLDYAAMQLTKDVNGQYLRPFRSGDELVQGLSVETTTTVTQGDFIMGDFNYLNIRDVWGLSMRLGWENDDFSKNIVTVLAEKRLMAYIKAQYKTAFVKDTFATVIEGITAPAAGVGG